MSGYLQSPNNSSVAQKLNKRIILHIIKTDLFLSSRALASHSLLGCQLAKIALRFK